MLTTDEERSIVTEAIKKLIGEHQAELELYIAQGKEEHARGKA